MRRRKSLELSPERRRELRREKSRKRRQERKQQQATAPAATSPEKSPEEEAQFWLGMRVRSRGHQVINEIRDRPYWLSLRMSVGSPPVSGYFPVVYFQRGNRWFYGFLFREHREAFYRRMKKAGNRVRKELTGGKDVPRMRDDA